MTDLPTLQRAARASPVRPSLRNVSSSSTAYTGSQGYIDGDARYDSLSFDLERSDYESIQLPPASAHTARPALSSRLMSSFSNSQPAASALTRSKSILHSRAKSLAAFVPKLNSGASNTASAPSSPERQQQQQQPHRLFGDLFAGESAPMRMGFAPTSPSKEKEETEFIMEYRPTLTSLPSSGRRRSNAPQTPTAPKTGWFGRKNTAPATPTHAPVAAQDELASLNIWTSLFPAGPVDDLTPHAFNDLLLNATTLLERMQTAYKEKVAYIASVQPEIEAQREEVEEVETRSRHLKLQLEDMSRRAQEQEQAMRELADQLAEERSRARESRVGARKVSRPQQQRADKDEEDEEATPRRRGAGKRTSGGSASDSGFESDVSRDTVDSFLPTPPPALTLSPSEWNTTQQLSAQPSFVSSGSTAVSSVYGGKGVTMPHEASAWATVEQLRCENRELRARVEGMDAGLQGVIDFVGGVQR